MLFRWSIIFLIPIISLELTFCRGIGITRMDLSVVILKLLLFLMEVSSLLGRSGEFWLFLLLIIYWIIIRGCRLRLLLIIRGVHIVWVCILIIFIVLLVHLINTIVLHCSSTSVSKYLLIVRLHKCILLLHIVIIKWALIDLLLLLIIAIMWLALFLVVPLIVHI